MDHKRLFVGIPVTACFLKPIAQFRHLNRHLQGIRWVPERNLHLTTFFIGKTPVEDLDRIIMEIGKIAERTVPFQLKLDQLCKAPPGKKPGMFWAMFRQSEKFTILSQQLSTSLSGEKNRVKKAIPHITLARFKYLDRSEKLYVKVHFDRKDLVANKLVLWESELGEKGPEYSAIQQFDMLRRD